MSTNAPATTADCPQAPTYRATLRTMILHEACEKAGGVSLFATLLGVTAISLNRWMDGEEKAPDDVIRACVEILLSRS
jgi:hypothetical protein